MYGWDSSLEFVENVAWVTRGLGTLYSSTADCLTKSVRAEGALSLWKGMRACALLGDRWLRRWAGFGPNFGRIGPHTTIMFLVIERLRHSFSST